MPPRKRKLPAEVTDLVEVAQAELSAKLPDGTRLEYDTEPILPDLPPAGTAARQDAMARLADTLDVPPEVLDSPPVMVTPPPTPTSYRVSWWPAQVHLPDGTVIRQAKVFATSVGLYIYTGRPDGDQPDYYFPIDYSKTPPPPADYALRQKAIRIITPHGEVRVYKLGGCGCNHPLKAWRPTWAHRIEPWSA